MQSTGNSNPQNRVQRPVNSSICTLKNDKFGKALDHRPDNDNVIGFDPHGGEHQRVRLGLSMGPMTDTRILVDL